MLDGLGLEPHVVLGVARDASAEAIREAYREKSKKHHPDHGGEEWAFKVVARAYEILSATAASEALRRRHRAEQQAEAPDTGRIRPGVADKGVAPERVVLVEVVWMRFEVGDFLELLSEPSEERNLSGSLHITWPDPALGPEATGHPRAEQILRALNAAFDELRAWTPTTSARSEIDGGRFEAWLGYANGPLAYSAFKRFRVGLKARGLGVRQWTRDVTVPRDDAGR